MVFNRGRAGLFDGGLVPGRPCRIFHNAGCPVKAGPCLRDQYNTGKQLTMAHCMKSAKACRANNPGFRAGQALVFSRLRIFFQPASPLPAGKDPEFSRVSTGILTPGLKAVHKLLSPRISQR
jgi:hypothetical protein